MRNHFENFKNYTYDVLNDHFLFCTVTEMTGGASKVSCIASTHSG